MALEPDLALEAALLSPQSGVFDSHGYMLALQGEIEDRGGAVVLATPFEGAAPLRGRRLHGPRRRRGADHADRRLLVTAPGLSAQAVAATIEGFPPRRSRRATTARACISA